MLVCAPPGALVIVPLNVTNRGTAVGPDDCWASEHNAQVKKNRQTRGETGLLSQKPPLVADLEGTTSLTGVTAKCDYCFLYRVAWDDETTTSSMVIGPSIRVKQFVGYRPAVCEHLQGVKELASVQFVASQDPHGRHLRTGYGSGLPRMHGPRQRLGALRNQ